jgi:uncharacterized protein (UPF0332 family)
MTIGDKQLYRNQKMANAKATINEISNLLKFEYLNNAVNRLYYASFYAVHALLSTVDIFPKSHKGVLQMFSLHFIKTGLISKAYGDFYSQLFQDRLLADYDDEETVFTKEYVENYLSLAKLLIEQIGKLLPEK